MDAIAATKLSAGQTVYHAPEPNSAMILRGYPAVTELIVDHVGPGMLGGFTGFAVMATDPNRPNPFVEPFDPAYVHATEKEAVTWVVRQLQSRRSQIDQALKMLPKV